MFTITLTLGRLTGDEMTRRRWVPNRRLDSGPWRRREGERGCGVGRCRQAGRACVRIVFVWVGDTGMVGRWE